MAKKPIRWEGPQLNPNGYRTMGDHANDLEEVLDTIENFLKTIEPHLTD